MIDSGEKELFDMLFGDAFSNKAEKALLDELKKQCKVVDNLKEEIAKLAVTNSHLVKKIEELREYERMYKDLCK